MTSRSLKLVNELGLHARASAKFVELAKRFESSISVLAEGRSEAVDGKNIMALLLLEATHGTSLEITAQGTDSQEALDALAELIDNKFGELPDPDAD